MPMDSACGNAALPALGFPIRESADHRLFSAYPRLIAAVHALHRLLVPRHPPCALLILTVITYSTRRRARGDTRYIGKTVQFSRTAHPAASPRAQAPRASPRAPARGAGRTGRRSLKTQQHAERPPRGRAPSVEARSTLLGP